MYLSHPLRRLVHQDGHVQQSAVFDEALRQELGSIPPKQIQVVAGWLAMLDFFLSLHNTPTQ